ncbi:MAG: AsmA family protein [Deltaproteobacteria bacterium]|nr:AsmA family protein [Deltaproteobacteria bacterium]
MATKSIHFAASRNRILIPDGNYVIAQRREENLMEEVRKRKTVLKILGIAGGGLFLLIIFAAVALTLLVDLNRWKPRILEAANQAINGRVELGDMRLSLWKGLRARIEDIAVKNSRNFPNTTLLQVKKAEVGVAFWPLLTGQVHAKFQLQEPQVVIVRNRENQNNISDLLAKPAEAEEKPKEEKKEEKKDLIEHLMKKAKLNLQLDRGTMEFVDQLKGANVRVENLNISLKNVGINQPIDFSLSTELVSKKVKDMEISGPLQLQGTLYPVLTEGQKLNSLSISRLSGEFGKTSLQYKDFLNKKSGVPFHFSGSAEVDQTAKRYSLTDGHLSLGPLELKISAHIRESSPLHVKLDCKTNSFSLSDLADIVPKLKQQGLKGMVSVTANIDESLEALKTFPKRLKSSVDTPSAEPLKPLNMSAVVMAQKWEVHLPGFKPLRGGDLLININPKELSIKDFDFTSGETSVKMSVLVRNWSSAPRGDITINASHFDLNDIIPPATEKKEGETPTEAPEKRKTPPLQKLQSSPLIRKSYVTGEVSVKKGRIKNFTFSSLQTSLSLQNGIMELKPLDMKAYGGSIHSQASIDLNRHPPYLTAHNSIENLDMNLMISEQKPELKDTIYGKLTTQADFAGGGFSFGEVLRRGSGNGSLTLLDSKFTTLNLTKAVESALSVIPGLKVKFPTREDVFDKVSSSIRISNGNVHTPDLNLFSKYQRVKVSGYFDLDQRLNYKGIYYLTPEPSELESIPFVVTGTFKNPIVIPDAATYIQRLTAKTLEKAVEGGLQKGVEETGKEILEGIGDILAPK